MAKVIAQKPFESSVKTT